MTPEQFTYWLQGYFEIANPLELNPYETKIIKNHLSLVFNKLTPTASSKPYCGASQDLDLGYLPLTTTHTGIAQKPLC